MPCTPGHTINHAITRQAISYASQAIPYTMPCPPVHTVCPSGHNIYHAMPTRPYHISCHVYPGNTVYHAITRQAASYASQAIPYTMPCPPVHTVCPSGHNICHAMPTRPYHISCHVYPGNTVYHAMPSQAIPNTMPYPPGHTINNATSARPYHIPCHACYGKGPKCLVTMSHPINYVYMYICRPFQYDCMSRWPYELVLVSVVVSLRCVLVTMERFNSALVYPRGQSLVNETT